MPDFSKAHIGDSVYEIRYGYGKITNIKPGDDYSIVCYFEEAQEQETYTIDGRIWDWHIGPVLFHAKPEISDPPPPKRMVKKSGWLNIYPPHFSKDPVVSIHGSKEAAEYNQTKNLIACIPIEWEE